MGLQEARPGSSSESAAFCILVQALIAIGDKGKAERLAGVRLRSSQDSGSLYGQAVAHELLATARLARGQLEEVLESASMSHSLIQDLGDTRWEARALSFLAKVHFGRQDFDEAMQALKEAGSLCQDLADCQGEVNILQLMIEVHMAKGSAQAALQCALDQEEVLRRLHGGRATHGAEVDISHGDALARMSLCRVYAACGDVAKALASAQEAAAGFASSQDVQGEAAAKHVMAELRLESGDADEALSEVRAAAKAFKDADNMPGYVRALRTKGDAHMERDAPEDAARAIEEALRACRKHMTDKRQEVELLLQLAKANMGIVATSHHGTVRVENIQTSYSFQAPAAQPASSAANPGAATAPDSAPQETAVVKKGLDLAQVENLISAALQSMVGTDEEVPPDTPLMDSGLDSLSSVQFRNDLQKQTGLSLPASIMFDYPTQRSLADRLVELSEE